MKKTMKSVRQAMPALKLMLQSYYEWKVPAAQDPQQSSLSHSWWIVLSCASSCWSSGWFYSGLSGFHPNIFDFIQNTFKNKNLNF